MLLPLSSDVRSRQWIVEAMCDIAAMLSGSKDQFDVCYNTKNTLIASMPVAPILGVTRLSCLASKNETIEASDLELVRTLP